MSWSLSISGTKAECKKALDSAREYNKTCNEPKAAEAAYHLAVAFLDESVLTGASISLYGHATAIGGSCSAVGDSVLVEKESADEDPGASSGK